MNKLIEVGHELANEHYPTTLLMYETLLGDPSQAFRRFIAPRIISAFLYWQQLIAENGDESQKEAIKSAEMYNLLLYNDFTSAFRSERGGLPKWDDAWYTWNIDTKEDKYRSSGGLNMLRDGVLMNAPELLATRIEMAEGELPEPEAIPKQIEVFFELCRFAPWAAFRELTGVPYGAILDDSYKGLPSRIIAGDLTWDLRFGRYYVPSHIKVPRYRKSYFDFLASRYKEQSDLGIKGQVFRSLFSLLPNGAIEVLDIGCGIGLAQEYKPRDEISLYGIDESEAMVSIANRAGEKAYTGKIEDIEFSDGRRFDHAMMSFVDYWIGWDDKVKVYSNIRKLVKPGGKLVLNIHKPQEGWQDAYSKILEECGYKSISFSSELIERTGGGMYTANYVVAEV